MDRTAGEEVDLEALALALLQVPDPALAARLIGPDAPETVTDWKREYDRLFLVPGPDRLVPLECAYRGRVPDGKGGRTWGRPDPEVLGPLQRLYRHFEFHIPDRFVAWPDHAGVELMFLWLLRRHGEAARSGDGTIGPEVWESWHRRFLADHPGRWLPDLAEDLERLARSVLYRAVAAGLRKACESRE